MDLKAFHHFIIDEPFIQSRTRRIVISISKNIKLSYEKIIHNKVYESIPLTTKDLDLFMAIPKGKKSFFWFYQKNIYSLTLSLNRETQNKIECIQKVNDLWKEDFSIFEGSIFMEH